MPAPKKSGMAPTSWGAVSTHRSAASELRDPQRQCASGALLYWISRRQLSVAVLLAVPLMHDSFGPMSQSLVNRNNLPLCDTLAALYPHVKKNAVGDPLCFSIEVNVDVGYWLAAAAVFVYLLSGGID